MCFCKRNYKIYHSKKKSLDVVRNWHFHPSAYSISDKKNPILLTVNIPLSIVVELANKYGSYFSTNTTVLDPDYNVVLEVFSKEMAEELIKRGSRVVVKK